MLTATALSKKVQVLWDDGNANLKNYSKWMNDLIAEKPDVIIFESTTPVMKFMWSTINKIKENLQNCLIVLTGYHSMRKPNESLEKSKTDSYIK